MRVGILGFAHGHVNSYCRRWADEPSHDVQVVAGWDHDSARLEKAAAAFGVRPCVTPGALLAAGVDAVVIAAETSLHADLVEQAAVAEKAIVLQKPIALTMEEASRIVAVVEAGDLPFTMVWQMRVDPQNLAMKALVESGRLGRIMMARRRHCLGLCLDAANAAMWHFNAACNRDIWADDAAHAADFLYWMFGLPATVSAELASLLHPDTMPNDNGVAVYRYADGMIAEVVCSFAALAGENTTEITAENGVVIQNHGDAPSAAAPRLPGAPSLRWMLRGDRDWTVSDAPAVGGQGERIAALAAPLAGFLHGRRPPLATAAEGRDVLRMILATYESNREGRRVAIEPRA